MSRSTFLRHREAASTLPAIPGWDTDLWDTALWTTPAAPPVGIWLPMTGPDAFDWTGATDESEHFETWANALADGADVDHLITANIPRLAPNGVTRTQFRIEGGPNGAVRLDSKLNIVFDGHGDPTGDGSDGAQF